MVSRRSVSVSEMQAQSRMASLHAEVRALQGAASVADLASTLATSAKSSDMATRRLADDVTKLEERIREQMDQLATAITTTQDELRTNCLPQRDIEAKAGSPLDGEDFARMHKQLAANVTATECHQAAIEHCKVEGQLVEMQVNALRLEHSEEVEAARRLAAQVDAVFSTTRAELQRALDIAAAQTESEVARVTEEVRVLSQDLIRQDFLTSALHEGVA
eukprot:5546136-Amphidinium_carterae.1